MRLSKTTSHAIRVLLDCAEADGRLVKVADLSTRLELTMQNVFKIVHLLSRAGLVAATRGRHGGVRLARAADQIHIGDVVRAIEATDVAVDADGAGDAALSAGVNKVFDDALDAFIGVLDQHSLADMLASRKRRATPARRDQRVVRGTTGRPRAARPRQSP